MTQQEKGKLIGMITLAILLLIALKPVFSGTASTQQLLWVVGLVIGLGYFVVSFRMKKRS